MRILTSSIDTMTGETMLVEYEVEGLDGGSLARAHQAWIERMQGDALDTDIKCISFTMRDGCGAFVLDEGETLTAGLIYTTYVSENRDDIHKAY